MSWTNVRLTASGGAGLRRRVLRCRRASPGLLGLAAIALLSVLWASAAPAQATRSEWTEPYRLSSATGRSSEGFLAADPYGYVHCFWAETSFADQRRTIQYARFDGVAWSKPNAVFEPGSTVNNLSPVVDSSGRLHIVWSEGLNGPAYYTFASAADAMSARSWAPPLRIDIPARTLYLRIDTHGVFHIVYINQMEQPGVYYVRSENQGVTWSKPVWLDPDILPDHIADSLSFELDDHDGLHVVWFYGGLSQSARADWVRYAFSSDGGHNWAAPLLLDWAVAEADHNLNNASPVMTVAGDTVHVVWAAGSLPYRFHRFSVDAGRTWSAPEHIFGELHGQAFDSLAVDGAGRLHFFGQIRYPQGIYHARWDPAGWTLPSLIYWISNEDSPEGIGDRVHAHDARAVVRAGNQLVLTFADGPADPNRRLFAMSSTLGDVAPQVSLPAPLPTRTPVPTLGPTPRPPTAAPTPTATALALADIDGQAGQGQGPAGGLWAAITPTLLFLGVIMVGRLILRARA